MVRVGDLPAGGTFAMSTRLNALPLADLTGVPNGTLLRSWGTATSSRFFPGDWRGCTYTAGDWPSPVHSTNSCGDRLGLSRALARIEKETIPDNLVNTIDAGVDLARGEEHPRIIMKMHADGFAGIQE